MFISASNNIGIISKSVNIPTTTFTRVHQRMIMPAFREIAVAYLQYLNNEKVLEEVEKYLKDRKGKGKRQETVVTKVDKDERDRRRGGAMAGFGVIESAIPEGLDIPEDIMEVINEAFKKFDVQRYLPILNDLWEQANFEIYGRSASRTLRGFNLDSTFNLRNPKIIKRILDRTNFLSHGVVRDQFDTIRLEIGDKFYNKGWGLDRVAKHMTEKVQGLTIKRARSISRTESQTYINESNYDTTKQIGVEWKYWMWTQDDRVRMGHEIAGQNYTPDDAIRIDEPFHVPLYQIIGGMWTFIQDEIMEYPMDYQHGASAANIIQCRCRLGNRVVGGERLRAWAGE